MASRDSIVRASSAELQEFMRGVVERNPGELEYHQAVREVAECLLPFVREHGQYEEVAILERLTEPDRVVIFRVCWEDDQGRVQTHRAWRVQHCNAIGPYKGGMRFHPTVTLSVLKFLAFEQCFKNSLTGLPMGGGKGGSNFDPKGKSDREIMRFCHSLMIELHRHIGEDVDVPAGDIGVGNREISYLFGQYKRLENRYAGVLTGKGLSFGGSLLRKEATGYGTVYYCERMLERCGESLEGRSVAISGAGNVALYACEKALQRGARVLTLSDSSGFVHVPDGIDADLLEFVRELKEERRGRLAEVPERFPHVEYHAGAKPWGVACDVALPCATQNELDLEDARRLLDNGVRVVCEGANMPADSAAAHAFVDARILYGPGKAANAGGVAVSGLEQSQNALRLSWTREEVDDRLKVIMRRIHQQCVEYGATSGDYVDYVRGANVAGFVKVADALLGYGVM